MGLRLGDDATYVDMKDRLLTHEGLTAHSAGVRMFGMSSRDVSGKNAVETCRMLSRMVRRLFSGAETVDECHLAVLIALVRRLLPEGGKAYLDNQVIKTYDQLVKAMQGWWTISGGIKVEVLNSKPKPSGGGVGGRVANFECYNCGKTGHKAADCRSKSSAPRDDVVRKKEDGSPLWTCYTCGQKGHKSTTCPQKGKGSPVVKKERSAHKVTHAAWGVEDNVVVGQVNGNAVVFVLDSGASISVVPDSVVDEGCYMGSTNITDANGGVKVRKLARVNVQVGRIDRNCIVAVAPKETLGDKGLFAISLSNKEDFQLVSEYAQGEHRQVVAAVQTRSQATREREEAQRDREVVDSENAGITPMVLDTEECNSVRGDCEIEEYEDPFAGLEVDEDVESGESETSVVVDDGSEKESGLVELELPPVVTGGNREDLVKETAEDKTLEAWRKLADDGEKGLGGWVDVSAGHRSCIPAC